MNGTGDLFMCTGFFKTHFFQMTPWLFQVEVLPFLTESQLANGTVHDWFKAQHFQEMLELLQPVMQKSVDAGEVSVPEDKKYSKSKDCVLTGSTVRIACSFKQSVMNNTFLIHLPRGRSRKEDTRKKRKYQELSLHKEKLLVYVCPRASSSVLHLSQLVNNDIGENGSVNDISKYFVSSEGSNHMSKGVASTSTACS
ncbi:uncharacterized protein LOC101849505 [Aplysia californica]|uniref:Uncharacterized protein LOC101849505 n=1 Tax=Aplysia californica TaxID=6500 RepID=A0ABM0K806_APLCA|nr:uncharacterized protein LOC101849505 [Aplysia californica]